MVRETPATQSARILAIGDELLLGRTVDTNSAWLARWCGDHGLRVDALRVLGDDQAQIAAALRTAAEGAALVLVTGGLGPTEDDRTRHALAQALGVELRPSAQAWRSILAAWARLRPGAEPPVSNRRQALLPRGARLLGNDRGTAPGLLAQRNGTWIACLPGVPHEMEAMAERLAVRLEGLLAGLRVPTVGEVHLAGLGESRIQDQLGELLCPAPGLQVGITAHEVGHITVRCVGSARAVARRCAAVRRVLRRWLLPAEGLAASLVLELTRRRGSISAAESCTCGRIASALGAVPGASAVLRESLVTYADAAKCERLGVDPALLQQHGAVSEEVVRAMASGLRARAGATLALACSGIAGPGGGSRAKPVGMVWLAAASARRVLSRCVQLRGSRTRIQSRAAAQALLLGWELLRGPMDPQD